MDWLKILAGYLVIISLASVIIMSVDKGKARGRKQRISEKTLLFLAAIGGSPGIWLGMVLFRHKTKKLKFYLGVPITLSIQVLIFYLLLKGI